MQVIEIFLPLRRNDGSAQPSALFREVGKALVERFGGLTAYTRAPAEGFWERGKGAVDEDAIVILEVIAEHSDRAWWSRFRERLEHSFEQSSILIRAFEVEKL